jgi:FtsH-binding integral membrane protein
MNNYPYYATQSTAIGEATLIQRVCYLLCTSLLVTAGTAWWASANVSPALGMPLAIGTIVCVVAMSFARAKPGISLFLLYLLSVLEGLLIGPILALIVNGFNLGGTIVAESAAISTIIVGGVGTYAWMSTKDFGFLGRGLFWALIGLLVVGFIGMFVHMGAGGTLLYSLIGTAIFTGFVLYDVSNIKRRYGPNDYVLATVNLYLDFINIFWFVLQILLSLTGGGGRRSN